MMEGYSYEDERPWLLTDEGQRALLKVRDAAFQLIDTAGAVRFDRVFVCSSGSWTPPWLDEDFERFIARAPVRTRVNLDGMQRRTWDTAEVECMADELRRLKERINAANEEATGAR